MCVYGAEPVSRSRNSVRSVTHQRHRVYLKWRVYFIYFRVAPFLEDVLLVEFMYDVFTRVPGESYRRRFGSFLCSCSNVFRALINSDCWLIRLTDD